MVWCSVATIDRKGRPRSRVLHPSGTARKVWIATNPTSLKAKHLDEHPYVSLAYVSDVGRPVYVDCRAEWIDDLAEKQRVWDLIKTTPPPLGYDPEPIFNSPDHGKFGLLKLTPWRVEIYSFPEPSKIWHPEKGE